MTVDKAFDPRVLLRGASVPPWLKDFAEDPEVALEELLGGRAYLGHLAPLDPMELLGDWLRNFYHDTDFVNALDGALVTWIDNHWGSPLLGGSARVAAETWNQVAGLLATTPTGADGERLLEGAARRLRERLLADRGFLNALSEGRGRDPAGSAWRALARHQHDRELLHEWWRLCRLPADEPWHRGPIGVEGLAGLPPENPGLAGGFDKVVAEGLARLGEAFEVRVEEGWLGEEPAAEEFQVTMQLLLSNYPFEDRWRSFWRHALAGRPDSRLAAWVRALLPGLRIPENREPSGNWPQPDLDWPRRAREIATKLQSGTEGSLEKGQTLLAEQRAYADRTGNTYYFVRSAVNFANCIRERQPERALGWALEARQYEPASGHAWTTVTNCLLELGRHGEALINAVETARRFPESQVVQNILGVALKEQGRFGEAKVQFNRAMESFPNDPVAHNGLAEVFRAEGELEKAEGVYREALERGFENSHTYNGLGAVLKEQGRFDEAKAQFSQAMESFPNNPVALHGLAEVFRAEGELEKAEGVYREALERGFDNIFTYRGLATVLKEQGRFKEANALLRRVKEHELGPDHTAETSQPEEEAIHFREPPSLDNYTIAHLTADAYLLRRWARHSGDYTPYLPTPGTERARMLLERLRDHMKGQPEAAAAYGLLTTAGLDSEEADLAATVELLEEAEQRFPGSARVRYALAFAKRILGQSGELPWRRIVRLDPRLEPVRLLGGGRTLLKREADKGRDALGQLAFWCNQYAGDGVSRKRDEECAFLNAWCRRLQTVLFDDGAARDADTLANNDTLLARLSDHAVDLDELEEEMVERHAWA